jgi:hypothetical protein
MRRIGMINGNGYIAVVLAGVALFMAGCSGTVTNGGDNGATELSLEEGDGANVDACTSGVVGDGVTCETPDVWKLASWEVCSAQGLILTELAFEPDCADGRSTHASYACCAAPPPPEPDPTACTAEVLGDGVTCQSPEQWKVLLAGANGDDGYCAAQGLVLHDVFLHNDCADGGSTYAKISCCPASSTPPEPDPNAQVCAYGALGDGTTCHTTEEWLAEVEAICATKNRSLVDLGVSNDCEDGSSSYAKFSCCAP